MAAIKAVGLSGIPIHVTVSRSVLGIAELFSAFAIQRGTRQKTFVADDVTIRDVATTTVAIMEHRGNPATLGATIQRFIAWRKAAGLPPKTNPTFNVWRSEQHPASPADYSVDLCVGTDRPIDANGEQVRAGEIPGGYCASSATPTVSSLRHSTSIATGCPLGMRWSPSCFCR